MTNNVFGFTYIKDEECVDYTFNYDTIMICNENTKQYILNHPGEFPQSCIVLTNRKCEDDVIDIIHDVNLNNILNDNIMQ